MFRRKKDAGIQSIEYDLSKEKPILRCSICTGEKVFGFKDIATGKFREVGLITDDVQLARYMEICDISHVDKEY